MKKWEKEILQKQLNDEEVVLKQLKTIYNSALSEVQNKIQVLMSKEQTQSVIYQLKYQQELEKQLSTVFGKMSSDYYYTIDEYLTNCYEDTFYSTMYSLHNEGIPVVMPFDQKQAAQMAAQSPYSGIKLSQKLYMNNIELAHKVKGFISRGIAMNESYADISRRIAAKTEASVNQAYRIVRTEGHRIQNEVKFQTAAKVKDEKGADIVKQWDSTVDKRTRPDHVALDGQLREMEQPFKIPKNGYTAMFPGGFGIAKEDINCRCVYLQRARWALDKSELDKLVGDLDGATDEQLDEWAQKLGVSKDELIKKSNGIIESDGSINHTIKAQNYNQFKKKYQTKAATQTKKLESQLDVAQKEYDSILSKYKDENDLMLFGSDEDINKYGSLKNQINDLQNQLGVTPQIPKATVKTPAPEDWDTVKTKYKDFGSDRFASDQYHEQVNFDRDKWDNDLTKNERHGIYNYTSNDYSRMNRILRGGGYKVGDDHLIDYCTDGLKKWSVKEDCVVYRGMGDAYAFSAWTNIPVDKLADKSVQQSLIGSRLVEKAFMSTGVNSGSAWSGIRLKVYVPAGTKGMYVDPISAYSGEKELLIQRNSTFEVKDIETDSNGYITQVVLKLVEQSL